jgi:hypothetical protein
LSAFGIFGRLAVMFVKGTDCLFYAGRIVYLDVFNSVRGRVNQLPFRFAYEVNEFARSHSERGNCREEFNRARAKEREDSFHDTIALLRGVQLVYLMT